MTRAEPIWRVGLRAPASRSIGWGHVRRCLSLALALQRLGAEVRLAMPPCDVQVETLARQTGVKLDAIDDESARELVRAWGDWTPDWVVVDHYGLDASWQDDVRMGLGCKLAVIDDLADRPLAPDLLIDHNFVPGAGHRAKYQAVLRSEPLRWCCGPRFALLDPVYQDADPIVIANHVRSIGIFMGGTDPAHMSLPTLRACRAAGFAGPIEIAATSHHPNLQALRDAVARDPLVTLTLDQPHLRDFFSRHDLQIGAGGGATWERCRLGVPALTLSVADNQRAVIPALAELGAIAATPDLEPAHLVRALEALLSSFELRQALAGRARALVDGHGAERVALAMAGVQGSLLTVRRATLDDARLMWAWRNDPATRAVSRDAAEIAWPQHETWLRNSLGRNDRHLFVAAIGARQVGVIRFDQLGPGKFEVSLYLDPLLHGLGLGPALLAAGERALASSLADQADPCIQAEVLPGNQASQRLFRGAGYTPTSTTTFTKSITRGQDAHR